MTSPSAGDADESLPNTSRSRIRSSVQDVKPTTNTLKDQLTALLSNPRRLGPTECYVGQIIKQLDKETSQVFVEALANEKIRHVDLLRLCAQEGYKMSEATMRRHRARGCRCPR